MQTFKNSFPLDRKTRLQVHPTTDMQLLCQERKKLAQVTIKVPAMVMLHFYNVGGGNIVCQLEKTEKLSMKEEGMNKYIFTYTYIYLYM